MRDGSSDTRGLYSLAGGLLIAVALLASIFFGGLMAGAGNAKKIDIQVEASLQ